jgi:rSAM/selenodomain-associated transferase 2
MISIIIPIYNEEAVLSKSIAQLQNLSRQAALLFVDGGSTDRSVEIVSGVGSLLRSGRQGRSLQMNKGGFSAKGDILIFMHADTMILPDTLSKIEEAVNSRGFVGGCLTQRIDKDAFIYRLIETQGNNRAHRTNVFYGDQGIFVKKDVFERIGGFPEAPIMEDVLFTQQLRKMGKTVVLPDRITVSARRWEKRGIIKTTLLFNLIILLFRLKVPLHQIKQFYEDIR